MVATGDELVEVGAAGRRRTRSAAATTTRCARRLLGAGYRGSTGFTSATCAQEIEHRLWHILAEYDVVLIAGGVSKGKFDFLPEELDRQGVQKIFHGVAQRPGQTVLVRAEPRGELRCSRCPGNPVSAYTCLHRYVLPALAHASGVDAGEPPRWSRSRRR